MHELGIVFHIVKTVENIALENQAEKVRKVVLQIGEVSTIIPYYLKDCWKWKCSKSELMDGCELEIETIPAITFCEDCEETIRRFSTGRYVHIVAVNILIWYRAMNIRLKKSR